VVLVAFSITPIGQGPEVADAVAAAVGIVRASGLPNETNAMFTNVEGDWDEVMAVVKRCLERVAAEAPRVSLVLKVDHWPDAGSGRLEAKVEAVERRLSGGPRGDQPRRDRPDGNREE